MAYQSDDDAALIRAHSGKINDPSFRLVDDPRPRVADESRDRRFALVVAILGRTTQPDDIEEWWLVVDRRRREVVEVPSSYSPAKFFSEVLARMTLYVA